MALGFVLVRTAPGKERAVQERLLRVPEIVELQPLFGEFDLLAKVEAPDFDTLGRVVVGRIRAVEGILDTKTLTEAPL